MDHREKPSARALALRRLVWWALAAGMTTACSGTIDTSQNSHEPAPPAMTPGLPGPQPGGREPTGPLATPEPTACRAAGPAAPLRRLTRREYDQTVADLLGDTTAPARAFTPEAGDTGFDTAAAGAALSDGVVEQLSGAARALAKAAVADLPRLLGCAPTGGAEDTCARAFIASFGRRAFRRALSPDEKSRYEALYVDIKTRAGFAPAVELVLRAFLTAPQFLYRIEGPALTGHDVATRLSYFFWGTTPDEALLAAADAGGLDRPEGVADQARRLLAHERGGRWLRDFHVQWLGVDGLAALDRGSAYSPALAAAMRAETETYFDTLVRGRGASLRDLFTSTAGFATGELSRIYGVEGGGAEPREITRAAARHRGFLTQAAVLTAHALPTHGSPITRGKLVREALLCAPLPPPPANADTTVPPADASKTARQQLELRTQTVEPCKACHALLNPPGFAFGAFDQIGRWKDTDEQRRPIDTSGALVGTDVDGAFTGATDFVERLADSAQVRTCLATQWFRYAAARRETDADACTRQQLEAVLAQSGDLRAFALRLVASDLFLAR